MPTHLISPASESPRSLATAGVSLHGPSLSTTSILDFNYNNCLSWLRFPPLQGIRSRDASRTCSVQSLPADIETSQLSPVYLHVLVRATPSSYPSTNRTILTNSPHHAVNHRLNVSDLRAVVNGIPDNIHSPSRLRLRNPDEPLLQLHRHRLVRRRHHVSHRNTVARVPQPLLKRPHRLPRVRRPGVFKSPASRQAGVEACGERLLLVIHEAPDYVVRWSYSQPTVHSFVEALTFQWHDASYQNHSNETAWLNPHQSLSSEAFDTFRGY
ncbi:hypothetical protein BDP81DRAFT_416824 [Colletotrichum phormii]|uniref:Uncharacterized protein n=1 Tax=Colletotrichum phormii TaxID=359342 RepID=A0AAJ0EJ56_9PEZI|nr:uncharacterized protein BDP81DRAFT_416824 [Colletotrichum phormii]KAK1654930.1 hypothetical protein BDP81DRAFT_416824 [Colletotrichum phormii]